MSKHIIICILLSLSFGFKLSAQAVGIGGWQSYLPYLNVEQVVDAGDKVFAVSNVYYYSYDKETGELQRYDKVWGLSDVDVNQIAYSKELDVLLVSYNNTNLDLILNGNEVLNLSDIQRESTGGDKTINSIYINDGLAYICMNIGIVVLDMEEQEFADTYVIGTDGEQINVNEVTISNGLIYAATDEGVKRAALSSEFLANYQDWELLSNGIPAEASSMITSYQDKVIAVIADTIFSLDQAGWSSLYYNDTASVLAINGEGEDLLVSVLDTAGSGGTVLLFDASGNESTLDISFPAPQDVLMDENGTIWVADQIQGLHMIENGQIRTTVQPNGPFSSTAANLAIRDGALWVAPGGVSADFSNVGNADGYFVYKDGWWNNVNQFTNSALNGVFNIYTIYPQPNSDVTWFGTFWDGMLKLEDGVYTKYNQDDGFLLGQIGDGSRTKVGGFIQDSEGNIWLTNSGNNRPIHAIKPDGTWIPFTIPTGDKVVSQIVLDDAENKWAILPSSTTQGIVVLNYGANIDDPNDDIYKILDGNIGNGALHNADVRCIVKDNDGEMWIGTNEGIAVFYCASSVLSESGCDAQRILVERDGFAGFLLEQERVNCIAVDGGNRKWVGTNNGLWLFSPDGLEELAYYTIDNSPLMSNVIRALAIDGETGLVYIATEEGLMSVRGEATAATSEHEDKLQVFPNPVREDYNGPIAIRGLATNAEVKITDANGTLIYQTQANGGQAIWDGRDYNGRKAKSGVYLIFSMNEEGNDSKTGKLLLLK